ncbi:hypothetical protein [Cytobacillus purgationiresistens]|uniref:Uncharacterized protein n=1 Tax=Cytobacillus purgationiresistens TaxID=863449 RepID=A0ABU0AKV3_9BACI|nr:hypothetical protein [Cytobacillus purgationiresistens]MDQ0271902.1 hypothetical protein [Cytobacillus purgationiresistens]
MHDKTRIYKKTVKENSIIFFNRFYLGQLLSSWHRNQQLPEKLMVILKGKLDAPTSAEMTVPVPKGLLDSPTSVWFVRPESKGSLVSPALVPNSTVTLTARGGYPEKRSKRQQMKNQ